MCISTMGAMSSPAVFSMSGSNSPPDTSLIQSAPAKTAALATAAFRVSTLMVTPSFSRTARITGTTRRISSSAGTSGAPGRVDSPPMSMTCAPAPTMASAAVTASSSRMWSPPSVNESGVTFRMPMTRVQPPRRSSGPPGRPWSPPAMGSNWQGQEAGLAPGGSSPGVPARRPSASSATVGCPCSTGWRHAGHSSAMGTRTKSRSCMLACGTSMGCVLSVVLNVDSPTATISRSTTLGPRRSPGVRPTVSSMDFMSAKKPCRCDSLDLESSSSTTALRKGGWSVTY
mmetsp:Transcript_10137/g.30387  ORF Transcript_10137/g.30387 Transcript_10137/m.30387 type:complete len:286 (+) Transcript_10137:474-1331(+)